ncbi:MULTISPECIES: DUF3139 domain-containing protein [Bacillus]|uniref:DUF3139 domain-containing protein n=2 Tax=Bacillus cereus group TaxID=86661 RepID=A0A150B673_BACCE|nr:MULTISPECIES: DUF3139 domain-containing protein [Bacillus]KLA15416.1 hypothetical protein B4087_0948 [Bacillus cereus]KMP55816.1 hypothetical protein TU57_16635 [Bacillus cereus]KXX99595.1 hypothetical protein AT274_08145 [Bacillus cereus]MCG3786372.1 DUF3139 domain-containing protein [Bacillus sp. UTDS19-33BHI26]MDA1978851.1 DUF3139 domain-containing protein [Bacillus cereus]
MLSIAILLSCSIFAFVYFVIFGPPINEKQLLNRVETYLIEQGDKKEDIKSMKIQYHWTTNYYVEVTYKDEPNAIYMYTYAIDYSINKKTVHWHNHKLIDGADERNYQFKHLHKDD